MIFSKVETLCELVCNELEISSDKDMKHNYTGSYINVICSLFRMKLKYIMSSVGHYYCLLAVYWNLNYLSGLDFVSVIVLC